MKFFIIFTSLLCSFLISCSSVTKNTSNNASRKISSLVDLDENVSNGGDEYIIDFINYGHFFCSKLNEIQLEYYEKENLCNIIENAKVKKTDKIIYSKGKHLKYTFDNDNSIIAVNEQQKKEVTLNHIKWKKLSQEKKETTIIHVYLLFIGIDDSKYTFSTFIRTKIQELLINEKEKIKLNAEKKVLGDLALAIFDQDVNKTIESQQLLTNDPEYLLCIDDNTKKEEKEKSCYNFAVKFQSKKSQLLNLQDDIKIEKFNEQLLIFRKNCTTYNDGINGINCYNFSNKLVSMIEKNIEAIIITAQEEVSRNDCTSQNTGESYNCAFKNMFTYLRAIKSKFETIQNDLRIFLEKNIDKDK